MTTASPLAARLGAGSGMFTQEKLAVDETAAPAFRKAAQEKAPGAKLMSDGQKNLLRDMISEREGQDGVQEIKDRLNKAREGGYLTAAIFTETFEALKAIAKVDGKSEQTPQRLAKRNQYGGECNQCGRRVAAQAGFVIRSDEDKWVVWHEVCPSEFPFPEGRYAIFNEDEELRFYHLVDGEVFVMASDNEYPIHGHSAEAIVAKIGEDPLEAAKRYGIEIGACGVCGRTLTSDWRLVGIGPVCSQKAFA